MKSLNRWILPFVALVVVALAIFPNRVLSLFGGNEPAEVRAKENETLIMISVPGMT